MDVNFERAKDLLEENDGAGIPSKRLLPVLIELPLWARPR
jgi:hypothetical protein